MKKVSIVFFVTVLLFSITNCHGQQYGKRISHTTVAIFNNGEKAINIKLGLTLNNLAVYAVQPKEMWLSPTFPLGSRPICLIKTNDKETKYNLRLNKTYMIYWNNRKKLWDMKLVKNQM